MELEGYETEIRQVFKGAFRCYIKFPRILFQEGLSGHREEKILIQLDTASHDFYYKQERVILNKFDVFTEINVTPLDIILSQKIFAVFNRKTPKGRDFYDIIFLLSRVKPNYDYLKFKLNIANGEELRKNLLALHDKIDFDSLVKDVKPFLFNPKDAKRINLFIDYIKSVEL